MLKKSLMVFLLFLWSDQTKLAIHGELGRLWWSRCRNKTLTEVLAREGQAVKPVAQCLSKRCKRMYSYIFAKSAAVLIGMAAGLETGQLRSSCEGIQCADMKKAA